MRSSLFASALALIGTAMAIPTISIKGSKFFTSEGNQYFLKGIAYQLVPDDPLIDGEQCARDAALMQDLGANAIRVYHVDPNANHDSCMNTFADAGIYLWLDLDTFDTQITQDNPKWNQTQYEAFQKVMDAFTGYDNLAGFYVGNEVMTTGAGSSAAPYVKAAIRDMKSYRNFKNYRNIPIGYSAADIATLRPMLQNYLACGDNQDDAIEFFALNAYEWCGQSTYNTSGYSILTEMVTSYNVPIYFSETGCNTVKPRTFDDQEAILGPEMTPWWSGAIIYEWIEEANNYGLISYGPKVDPKSPNAPPDGFPRSGTPTPVSPDFPNLSRHWQTLNPTGVRESDYTPTLTPPPCPAATAGTWEVDPAVALPSVGKSFVPRPDTVTGSVSSEPTSASSIGLTSRSSGGVPIVTTHSSQVSSGQVLQTDNAATPTGTSPADATNAAPSASSTTAGAASIDLNHQLTGMCAGLALVTFGFFWFL